MRRSLATLLREMTCGMMSSCRAAPPCENDFSALKKAIPGGTATRTAGSHSKGKLWRGTSALAGISANRSFRTRHQALSHATSSGSFDSSSNTNPWSVTTWTVS